MPLVPAPVPGLSAGVGAVDGIASPRAEDATAPPAGPGHAGSSPRPSARQGGPSATRVAAPPSMRRPGLERCATDGAGSPVSRTDSPLGLRYSPGGQLNVSGHGALLSSNRQPIAGGGQADSLAFTPHAARPSRPAVLHRCHKPAGQLPAGSADPPPGTGRLGRVYTG